MALPLPKVVADVEAGGPFVTAAKGMNSLRKLQAEAEYAPYTAYANALSKSAYGQTAPATALAQILSSPAAANMDPALYNQLASQANNSLRSFNTGFIPNPQTGGGFGNSLAGHVIGGIINRLAPGMMNQIQNNPSGQVNSAQNAMVSPETSPATSGNAPGYNTQFSRQAGNTQVPGSMGANNPSAVNAAGTAALTTTATGQAANQNELQKQRSAAISAQSQTATQALKTLKAFSRNYDKSSYKGQFIGKEAENIPTLPGGNVSPEQLANRYASQYLTDIAGLGDTPAGRTDEGRSLIASGKFDLSLDKDAKKEMMESTEAKLNRVTNLQDFMNDFYQRNPGATDNELVAMMNAYNRYAPSYDYEKGKPLPQNDKKFRDFTSPEALQSYRNNGDYNPYAGNKNGKSSSVEKIFDLTGFKNDHDFNQWYWKQNNSTKKQVDKQLKAGVY